MTSGRRQINNWLLDMDGVLVHEEQAIPGAADFIGRLIELEIPFLVFTNNSTHPPRPGARFIATNPDNVGPGAGGPLPATGSVAALITRATGVEPYFVGKPNPLRYPYRPSRVVDSVADLIEELAPPAVYPLLGMGSLISSPR